MADDVSALSDGNNNATARRSRSQRTRHQQAAHPQPDQQEPEQAELGFLPILNWVVFFFVMQTVVGSAMTKFMPPEKNIPDPPSPLSKADEFDATNDGAVEREKKPLGATMNRDNIIKVKPSCLWQLGTVMDLDVAITDYPNVPVGWPPLTTSIEEDLAKNDSSSSTNEGNNVILASWHQEGLVLGGISDEPDNRPSFLSILSSNGNQEMNKRNGTLTFPLTQSVWANETQLYAYVRLQRRGHFKDGSKVGDETERPVRKEDVLIKRLPLTRYRKRKKMRDVKSLLDTSSEQSSSSSPAIDANDTSVLTTASLNKTHDQMLLYIKPSLSLQLVDMGILNFPSRESIPRQFSDHMEWYEGEANGFLGGDSYYPIVYSSEFWITYASLKEVNGTMKESKLDITVGPVPVRFICQFSSFV